MKYLPLYLVILFSMNCFSQSYLSSGYTPTSVQSSFNWRLAQKVLAKKERDYNNAQKINCNTLKEIVSSDANFSEEAIVSNSSFVLGAEYFIYNGEGFVIVKIKKDDIYYTKYIYCGISYEQWNLFKDEGQKYSWGSSFNKYVEPYKCDCK